MTGAHFPVAVMARRAAELTGVLRDDESGLEEVAAVLRRHGDDPSTLDDPAELRQVADELYDVFAASTVDECVEVLNGMLARWCGPPRLSAHGGATFWHIHVDADDEGPWPEWLAASSAYALATLVAETGRAPGGICHAVGCDRPYVNTGSGAEQRYCSARCASRSRVAAYRRRQVSPPVHRR